MAAQVRPATVSDAAAIAEVNVVSWQAIYAHPESWSTGVGSRLHDDRRSPLPPLPWLGLIGSVLWISFR
jgi:hypothetical protein